MLRTYQRVLPDPNTSGLSLHHGVFLAQGFEELTVSVMGYKNSPAFFQRLMDVLLAKYRWQSAIAYIEDLIVWSHSTEQHAIGIENVLRVFDEKELTLSAAKAHVGIL